ncbi:MAG: hypothetical protein EHM61_28880 [Acidobacteria bacterium]|nr:MAG: hypothetical protein EHM61_28880 [Acidobacteriota bacterium]
MKSRSTLKHLNTEPVDVEAVLVRHGGQMRRWRVPIAPDSPATPLPLQACRPVLSDREAVEEASRCFRCGCGEGCMICHDICKMFAYRRENTFVTLDEDQCVGCGMCVWRCPNQNIEMIQTSQAPI